MQLWSPLARSCTTFRIIQAYDRLDNWSAIMALNHYAINQIIGGTMIVGHRPRFGRFGLTGAVGQMLAHRPRPGVKVAFDVEADRAVATGFAKIANGASAETVLIDRFLAKRFHTAAR